MRKIKEDYIGMSKTMNCGLKATIIDYISSKDITVQFENGIIRKHVRTGEFNKGAIIDKPISETTANRYLHMTKRMHCGLNATIIAYRNCDDIDIRFENGTVRKHVSANDFKKSSISEKPQQPNFKNKYINMKKRMKCGLYATVIAYRNANDIDILFENGVMKKHMSIANFKKGTLSDKSHPDNPKMTYVGTTKTMNNGMKATIIAYRSFNDIDVKFDNNTVKEHVRTGEFLQGNIIEKNLLERAESKYINMTKMMNCGINATIIAYNGSKNVDIQFETGPIRKNIRIDAFNKGSVLYPETDIIIGKYKIKKKAFRFENKMYFYVTFIKDNMEVQDVMCIDDMKQHSV